MWGNKGGELKGKGWAEAGAWVGQGIGQGPSG